MSSRRQEFGSPVLVRRGSPTPDLQVRRILAVRTVLLVLGLWAVGFYGYTLADLHVYQAYQNWAFDQQIAGRRATYTDYLRAKTPLRYLLGAGDTVPSSFVQLNSIPASRHETPVHGAVLGRISISRLNLSAMVREGVDSDTLSRAVGHVPSTALPGEPGNFAIAAHRDTLFRVLKDIRAGDLVTFQSMAKTYTYQVFFTRIVKPSNVSVLRPDGGLMNVRTPEKLLTMITCYPFYMVGSAPQRFIVQARLLPTHKQPSGTSSFHRS